MRRTAPAPQQQGRRQSPATTPSPQPRASAALRLSADGAGPHRESRHVVHQVRLREAAAHKAAKANACAARTGSKKHAGETIGAKNRSVLRLLLRLGARRNKGYEHACVLYVTPTRAIASCERVTPSAPVRPICFRNAAPREISALSAELAADEEQSNACRRPARNPARGVLGLSSARRAWLLVLGLSARRIAPRAVGNRRRSPRAPALSIWRRASTPIGR